MDGVKCRLCGERHRLGEAHIWPEGKGMANSMANTPNMANNMANKPLQDTTCRYRNKGERQAYMRNYMREKRKAVVGS